MICPPITVIGSAAKFRQWCNLGFKKIRQQARGGKDTKLHVLLNENIVERFFRRIKNFCHIAILLTFNLPTVPNNMRFPAYKFELMNFGRYTGQSPGLSVEMLANLPIDLPPLATQKKIAPYSILSMTKSRCTKKLTSCSKHGENYLYARILLQVGK